MKNKIIALMLIIPLLLIFTTFSLANVSSLYVPVSVSSISSLNNNIEYIELTENNTLLIENQILPLKADNQNVTYSFSRIGNNVLPIIEISSNGIISAYSTGKCKITTTTNDGGFVSSFILEVTSSLPLDFNIISNDKVKLNETLNLTANFTPSNSNGLIKWYSSNNNIAKVEELTGKLTPIQSGEVTVTAILQNGLNGQIVKTKKITILKGETIATINGTSEASIKTYSGEVEFVASVDLDKVEISSINFEYEEEKFDKFEVLNQMNVSTANFVVNAKLKAQYLEATVNLRSNETILSTLTILRTNDLDVDNCKFVNLNEYLQLGFRNTFTLNYEPSDLEGVSIEVDIEDNGILSLIEDGDNYQIRALKTGTNKVKAEFYVNDNFACEISKTITVLSQYTSLNFVENAKTHGLVSDTHYVFGKYKIENDEYVLDEYLLQLTANETVDLNKIEFSTSDENLAVVNNGKLKVINSGLVTIYAESTDAKLLNLNSKASLTMQVVDGVNVSNYIDIVKATEDGKVVVVQDNINLGKKVLTRDSSGTHLSSDAKSVLQSEVKQIYTTGDYAYYTNNGLERPTINYCLEFKNDIYGNGYTLNAENITNIIDSTGIPYDAAVFKGPLNYVEIPNMASVKAQDNIVFLVRNDDVKIDNISLKACDDVDDLTKLNYIGTTLEIMGDNVTLFNSRVQNGRNVVRVFGDYEDNNKQITVNIENCILRNAREFILKIGTNKYILGDIEGSNNVYSSASPNLDGFIARNDNNINDLTFMENYVKTIVNLKNSVLCQSGLFSIGLECKFAGPCLDGKSYSSFNFYELGWHELAGTSYPAILNLIGDVRIYDYKDITQVDSSSLIEINSSVANNFPINFDIAEMITTINNDEDFNGILVDYNEKQYAHGGIVYYGGGKNYSIVNFSEFTGDNFASYTISFDDLQNTTRADLLKLAAGKDPFRFLMYNSTSSFSVQKQIDDLNSGVAFTYIRNINN